ncbi:MAG: phosphate ABC transporter permease subunit PstC [Proteobacteria bacterium]|nr:phosphate ABC transporter permease subunit PstC [Pseudomonadota bacterium]MBU4010851.1 phosphate ABC transporter permease subunit PstC [Pseudomonadota bacterium]
MINTGKFIEKSFFIAAIFSAALTFIIFVFMIFLSLPLFKGGLFFNILGNPWKPEHGIFGVYPMLIGTVLIVLLSLCWAFPLSLGSSVLISVIAPPRFSKLLKKIVQMMTGIPTVIYGFVGVFLLVPFIREMFNAGSGMNILTASLMLAMVISPTMIIIFTDSFENIPQAYSDAIDALGGSAIQKLIYVILPCSWKGILTGLILSLGRAMGDTLIALMIAGNAVAVPDSIFESARTLTSHIALVIAADFDSIEFRSIFTCGIVLYMFTTILILLVRFLGRMSLKNK